MHIDELLHKRILVTEQGKGSYSKATVEEIKILEISPSKKWVKIQNQHGQKFWRQIDDIKPIEVLQYIETDKPKT